jgi:hypothetical protein
LPDVARRCLTLPDVAWYCLTLPDVAWRCLTLPDVAWRCLTLPDVARRCLTLPDIAWLCLTLPEVAWSCLTLPDVALLCLSLLWMTPVTQIFLNFNYSTYCCISRTVPMLLGRPGVQPQNWGSIPIMGGYFSFLCSVHITFGFHEVLYLVVSAVQFPGVMGPDSEADG